MLLLAEFIYTLSPSRCMTGGHLTSSLHGQHMQQAKGTFRDNTYVPSCSFFHADGDKSLLLCNGTTQIKFLSHSDSDNRLLLLILIVNNTLCHILFMKQSKSSVCLPSHCWYKVQAAAAGRSFNRRKKLQPHACVCKAAITL